MKHFNQNYILWIYSAHEGYTPYEFDTIQECLEYEKYGSDWTITKRVDYEIKEILP